MTPPSITRRSFVETVAVAAATTAMSPVAETELGWLRIGLSGAQPSIGEGYISTGSLYLCTTAFLPLGLDSSNAFWSDTPAPWTSVRVWRGDDVKTDHAGG